MPNAVNFPPHNPYAAAFALGAVCGARTFTGPAFVFTGPAFGSATLPRAARLALQSLALGELVGDKLPATPSRLLPGPLAARAISGGVCGAVLCHRAGRFWPAGALLGAGGALLWAKLGHDARAALGLKLGVPDPAAAACEDALALFVGSHAARLL